MEEDRSQPSLYEKDFYTWTQEQAQRLRTLKIRGIDTENIAEEIETLGRSEAAALRSQWRLIALHLLKMKYQPNRATRSWRLTIARERINADRTSRENPGLRPRWDQLFLEAYEDGRRQAIAETGLPSRAIPVEPVFTLDQVRDDGFFP